MFKDRVQQISNFRIKSYRRGFFDALTRDTSHCLQHFALEMFLQLQLRQYFTLDFELVGSFVFFGISFLRV